MYQSQRLWPLSLRRRLAKPSKSALARRKAWTSRSVDSLTKTQSIAGGGVFLSLLGLLLGQPEQHFNRPSCFPVHRDSLLMHTANKTDGLTPRRVCIIGSISTFNYSSAQQVNPL
jgi:hypothetical protein